MGSHPAKMDPIGLVLKPPADTDLVSFETAAADHFVLAHHGIARCSEQIWTLTIDGLVDRELRLSMAELRARADMTITAVLECAGNPEDADKPTRFVGNARWRGVALRHLLRAAGVDSKGSYVWLRGVDWGTYAGVDNSSYLKDIPLHKALAGDVVIAYEMNGEPLTAEHGFPLRAIVPGYYGTNSVKWLSQISVQAERAPGLFTTTLYNTEVNGVLTPVWATAVNSRLTEPHEGDLLPPGPREVTGWAWAESPVTKVEISVDDGLSWQPAELDDRSLGPSWQAFRLSWTPAGEGTYAILARATDASGATQPTGLHINQAHRVVVSVSSSALR